MGPVVILVIWTLSGATRVPMPTMALSFGDIEGELGRLLADETEKCLGCVWQHSSLVLAADRYSNLFPRGDDGAELAAAEKFLLG